MELGGNLGYDVPIPLLVRKLGLCDPQPFSVVSQPPVRQSKFEGSKRPQGGLKDFKVIDFYPLTRKGLCKIEEIRSIDIDGEAQTVNWNAVDAFFEFALHIHHLGIFLDRDYDHVDCVVYRPKLLFDKANIEKMVTMIDLIYFLTTCWSPNENYPFRGGNGANHR